MAHQDEFGQRLARIETLFTTLLEELKRLYESLSGFTERLRVVEVKIGAMESMMVSSSKKDSSDENDRDAIWNICGGCGPDWRKRREDAEDLIKAQLTTLVEKRAATEGEMKGKHLAFIALSSFVGMIAAVAAIFATFHNFLPKTP